MIRWRADSTKATPVECAQHGYPHKDAQGFVQFENTHFDDERSCWERVLAEARAGLHFATEGAGRAREALAEAEVYLLERTYIFDQALKNQKERA